MTSQAVVETILRAVPGFDPTRTVDTFKAGDPAREVTGVAVTYTASCDVLQRALALHANLVVTHEPTYYDHLDNTAAFAGDPVVTAKQAWIEAHGLAVWRCHDSWHRFPGDGIRIGVARQLGWTAYQDKIEATHFRLPPTTLDALAADLGRRLACPGLRVVGAPDLACRVAALSPGCCGWETQRRILKDADVLVCGECHEWEAYEYVRDAAIAGRAKGLIVLGHGPSEEAGMAYLAEWLQPRLPSVPVHFVPAGAPFRTMT